MSGPQVSTDGGTSWILRREGLPPVEAGAYSALVQGTLFDPTKPTHLLPFGGSRRGWPSPRAPLPGARSRPRPTMVTPGARPGPGPVNGPPATPESALDATDPPTFFLDSGAASRAVGAVWRSDDEELSWTRSAFGVPASRSDDPRMRYCVVCVNNDHPCHDIATGGVALSADGGRTFGSLTAGLPVVRLAAVAFDPFQASRLVDGTYGSGLWQRELDPVGVRRSVGHRSAGGR